METTTDRRGLRRQATIREIIDAAWRLAERDGVAQLSLRDLAAEVGMQAPSLYNYFSSKDAIYDALFIDGYEALGRAQAEWAGSAIDLDGLIESTVAFFDFCQASQPRYQLMFTRAVPGWEPSAEAYDVSVAQYGTMATALESFGISDQATLDLWTATISGLIAQQLANDPTGDRWRLLVPEAVRMLLAHLPEEDPR